MDRTGTRLLQDIEGIGMNCFTSGQRLQPIAHCVQLSGRICSRTHQLDNVHVDVHVLNDKIIHLQYNFHLQTAA